MGRLYGLSAPEDALRTYSLDLRQRVLADGDRGLTTRAAATQYSVRESWVRRLQQRRRETGETAPRPPCPKRPPVLTPHLERLRPRGADHPDATLKELRRRLGVAVCLAALWAALRRLGLSVKKKVLRAAEQDRPDVKAQRARWQAEQPTWDPTELVFLDETWASTNRARRYGRGPKGQRLVCPVPHGHWKTTTCVAALRLDGLTAPLVIDGAPNGDPFVGYVEQVWVPTLRPGDVVVLDNLSRHQRAAARAAIEAAGASVRFRPPYSPDLNPIEPVFAKLKHLLRAAGERTVEGRWEFLGRALDAFSPEECQNYFRHCGYRATLQGC